MKYLNNFLFAATIMLLLMAGCDSSVMEDGATKLTLNLNAHVNGRALSTDPDSTFNVNGATISFASARMYLSEVTLIHESDAARTSLLSPDEFITVPAKNDSNEDISHTIKEQIILVRHDTDIDSYNLGAWPSGKYKEIRFKVGIAGTTNRIDPSQAPTDHPLAKQTDRNNHWNWNAGYLYLRIDGQVDTNGDTIPDDEWAVHLGTKRFLREVTLMHDFTLEKDKPGTLDIWIDYGKILSNVDLSHPDQRICHTMNNLPVANAVADQIPSAFEIDSQ